MRELGVELETFSLFGGKARFRGMPVRRFRWWQWLALPVAFLREYLRHPVAYHAIGRNLIRHPPGGILNQLENLLGLAFATIWAPHFRRTERNHIHAVWATAPAAAALLLRDLTKTPFTVGAHAYDVYRNGGDWLLETKLKAASLVQTSTEATRTELLSRGADPRRLVMIRRGLNSLPGINIARTIEGTDPVRLLTVGRLIEKKGLDTLLHICAALREASVPFECRVVGGGPLKKKLQTLHRTLKLAESVCWVGPRSYQQVEDAYCWADLFCFTGRIAASADRDGLPNVIGEAMAHGLPVLTTPVSGTTEAISHQVNGYIIRPTRITEWVEAIRDLRQNAPLRATLGREGRAWVETHFDARKNASQLLRAFNLAEAVEKTK